MRWFSTGKLVACVSCAVSTSVWAGPDWVEDNVGDAGNTVDTTQPTTGAGGAGLKTIKGKLNGVNPTLQGPEPDLEDMYLIFIEDPANFRCTTISCTSVCDPDCGGCAEFNTQLWLFDPDGLGLLGNQTHFEITANLGKPSDTQGDSELDNSACDETGQVIDRPGLYIVAITQFQMPQSAGGPIFEFDDAGGKCSFGEDSGPDGDGGGQPLTSWFNNQDAGSEGAGAEYVMYFDGVRPAIVDVTLGMDIKPGGCPNPWNPGSNGVLPVALCGSPTLDIGNVIKSSVRMSRPDGVGGYIGNLAPHEGPPGPHSTYGDSATPYAGDPGGCHTLGGDGILDLNLKFKSQQIADQLQFNTLLPGAVVEIVLRGDLTSGGTFIARDWIRLVPPNAPPGLLTVQSTVGGSWIDASPVDLNLDGGGFGKAFQRSYPQSTVVVLQAQPLKGMVFKGWQFGSQNGLINTPTLNVTISGPSQKVYAIYEPKGTSVVSPD